MKCGFDFLQLESVGALAAQKLHAGWDVLLQHYVQADDQGLVCLLMTVSAGMRAVVMQHCRGRLSLYMEYAGRPWLLSFAKFLPRQAALLCSLSVDWMPSEDQAVLCRAFWEAGSKLRLQALDMDCPAHLLLQQVAALPACCRSGLTSLHVCCVSYKGGSCCCRCVLVSSFRMHACLCACCHERGYEFRVERRHANMCICMCAHLM